MKITKSIMDFLIKTIDDNGYEFTLINDSKLTVLNKNKETMNIIVQENCYILEYNNNQEKLYKTTDLLDRIDRS